MKIISYTLTILIFLTFISCSDEETSMSPELNSNLETLGFSFLENTIDNHYKSQEENIVIINTFLNNFDRVLINTPIDEFLEEDVDIETVNKGMSTLILSDRELYDSFLELKENKISISDIRRNLKEWNNSSRALCIPNIEACARSLAVYVNCSPNCLACCLAGVGVEIHCCTSNQQ